MKDCTASSLVGPVRTLRIEHARWDSDRAEWLAPTSSSRVTRRRDGQPSGGESVNPDGSAITWARVYDTRGLLIEERWWRDGTPGITVIHTHDDDGRLTGSAEVAPDGTRR